MSVGISPNQIPRLAQMAMTADRISCDATGNRVLVKAGGVFAIQGPVGKVDRQKGKAGRREWPERTDVTVIKKIIGKTNRPKLYR